MGSICRGIWVFGNILLVSDDILVSSNSKNLLKASPHLILISSYVKSLTLVAYVVSYRALSVVRFMFFKQ